MVINALTLINGTLLWSALNVEYELPESEM